MKIQSYNSTLVLIIFLILIDVLLKDNLSVRYVWCRVEFALASQPPPSALRPPPRCCYLYSLSHVLDAYLRAFDHSLAGHLYKGGIVKDPGRCPEVRRMCFSIYE